MLRLTEYFPVLLFIYAQRDETPKNKRNLLFSEYLAFRLLVLYIH
jgi:hypothetical protein